MLAKTYFCIVPIQRTVLRLPFAPFRSSQCACGFIPRPCSCVAASGMPIAQATCAGSEGGAHRAMLQSVFGACFTRTETQHYLLAGVRPGRGGCTLRAILA